MRTIECQAGNFRFVQRESEDLLDMYFLFGCRVANGLATESEIAYMTRLMDILASFGQSLGETGDDTGSAR